MLSNQVKLLYDSNNVEELYKFATKYFERIDEWADKFVDGDLLDEYELKYSQQVLNGCQTKLNPVAGALEALVVEYENNYFIKERFNSF